MDGKREEIELNLDEIIGKPITGVRPFNELPIDAEIWREAHNHHHMHRLLHAAAVHRSGIVYGLEVVASSAERTVSESTPLKPRTRR